MTYNELEELCQKIQEKYKIDLEADDEHEYPFSPSLMYGLNKASLANKYNISYYLVQHRKVRKDLIEYFLNTPNLKGSQHLIPLLKKHRANHDLPVVKEGLQAFLNPQFLHKKLQREKKNKKGEITIQTLYKIAYEAYTNNVIDYVGYYYSTKQFCIKTFDFVLNITRQKAILKNFHDNDSDPYAADSIKDQTRVMYITLFKKGVKADNELHLLLHKPIGSIANASILTGSFAGVSMDDGEPICSELILVNQTDSEKSIEENELKAKRHLHLQRKRIKVVPQYIFNDPRRYFGRFRYRLDRLAPLVGTHIIGRFDSDLGVVVSILRLYRDYSATLEHPFIDDSNPLDCLIEITRIMSIKLHIQVLYSESRTPIISFITSLSGEVGKTSKGAYCGISRYDVLNGDVVIYNSDKDPLSKKISPEKIPAAEIEARINKYGYIKKIVEGLRES